MSWIARPTRVATRRSAQSGLPRTARSARRRPRWSLMLCSRMNRARAVHCSIAHSLNYAADYGRDAALCVRPCILVLSVMSYPRRSTRTALCVADLGWMPGETSPSRPVVRPDSECVRLFFYFTLLGLVSTFRDCWVYGRRPLPPRDSSDHNALLNSSAALSTILASLSP